MAGISHWHVVELDDLNTPNKSVATRQGQRAWVSDIKASPAATIVYNDVKSELCLDMVLQTMFPTREESYILAHRLAAASKHQHNLANFLVSEAFIRAVRFHLLIISSIHHDSYVLGQPRSCGIPSEDENEIVQDHCRTVWVN